MANISCSLNIHCIFSTKERAPMLNLELRERLWPFLGGIAKQTVSRPDASAGFADHFISTNICGTYNDFDRPSGTGSLCIATQALRAWILSWVSRERSAKVEAPSSKTMQP